jgi:hypothetical protein
MKKYVVNIPEENRTDNPYINDNGYLSFGKELIVYDSRRAKDKAKFFNGKPHLFVKTDKPINSIYCDYVIKDSKIYVIFETDDNRTETRYLGRVPKTFGVNDRIFDFIETEKEVVIVF